jgi:hypothetical protein
VIDSDFWQKEQTMNRKLLSIVACVGIATGFVITGGCGEPKAPPPGAPTEKMDTPPSIDLGNTPPVSPTAPTDKAGAPTESPAEKDAPAGEPGEK